MPIILKRVSVAVQEKLAEDLLTTEGLWLECPVRLTPARLSNDRPDYASRVMQISKPGPFQVVVKNDRVDPIAVVVWVAMPSSLGALTDSASRPGGLLGQHGTPVPTCPMVHIVSPGQTHTIKGFAVHSRCCQAGGVQRFSVPASQLSAQQFQKLKVAAYPVKGGAAGAVGACNRVEEGAQSGTLAGTVPLAQFSLYVGRIGVAAASIATPAAMADPTRLPPPPARPAVEATVAKNNLRGMAVYDFSRDSDDEATGGAAALPAITRGLKMNVCANDGRFRTRTVPVDIVDEAASVLLEAHSGARGSSSGWGAPVMEEMGSASESLEPGAVPDTAATTQPVHELESAEANAARAASSTLRLDERRMTAEEERSFVAFVRRAVTACSLDLPAPMSSTRAALAGVKRVRDGGHTGEAGDSDKCPPVAAADASSILAPPVLLWDMDGNPICSLRGVTAARDGCVVVSVTPGDTFVPLDVVGTQLAVEEP